TTWVGSPDFHGNASSHANEPGNNWHRHFLPGFAAAYGPNWVNASVYDLKQDTAITLFSKPVLLQTLYYPAYQQDTLNENPVSRNHYLVTVYDEDTNRDGMVTTKDLRRLYVFDRAGRTRARLLPANHTVLSCTYDPANDFLYVYTREDENDNGQMEVVEARFTYWVDLNNPNKFGLVYGSD
ncbi:MAG: hypothetical protein AAFZ52_17445, partial [Bacteroidota bacterium]